MASMADMAKALRAQALIAHGFTSDEAMDLTAAWQTTVMQASL
jgi:hypothetical protein